MKTKKETEIRATGVKNRQRDRADKDAIKNMMRVLWSVVWHLIYIYLSKVLGPKTNLSTVLQLSCQKKWGGNAALRGNSKEQKSKYRFKISVAA